MIVEMDYPTPTTAEEGYRRTHRLIFHQVHKMVHEYGGNFDDLLSEAHEFFLRGHNDFMRGTTSTGRAIDHDYHTEIRRHVWRGLFDNMRVRANRDRTAPTYSLDAFDYNHDSLRPSGMRQNPEIESAKNYVDNLHTAADKFRPEEFVAELSADGAYVAELVLNPPVAITRDAEEKGGTSCNYRATVRSYLILMGWSAARVRAAFEEIKEALG